ncbi:hypothetical protein CAC02_06120 [Streptococcus gallolyticus]|uniref:Uncharacterized protein n=1 Tax=Streptococcus gallolyticus TaxID=315405 RepID=A0A368UDZ3_9STRE|nr:PTS transporter subunit EIIC [Streptococcus gallolyticus]RCW16905.1 hypothetical protein CAC02_06120 [Streptococcus gallolyticus]
MDYNSLGKDIIQLVGGADNIQSLTHCATRLRFVLRDVSKADKTALKKVDGVLGVLEKGGQLQIVIGNAVSDVYKAISKDKTIPLLGEVDVDMGDTDKRSHTNTNLLNTLIDAISSIFTPMINVLCGTGVIKGLLAILISLNVISTDSGAYAVLNATADAFFTFLPILIAISASKKFQCNTYVAATLASAMCYPDIISLVNEGAKLNFFGLPLTLVDYTSTVIPIIVAVYVLSKLERFLTRVIPKVVTLFLVPAFSLLIMVPLTFLMIGPALMVVQNGLSLLYQFLVGVNPILAGAIMGGMWQILVIFGVHWAFVPVMTANLSALGYDTFGGTVGSSNFSQAGASLGVYLKTKNEKLKQVAFSAAIAGIFGVTEPTIYGITLKYRRTFMIASLTSVIGGAIIGAFGIGATSITVVGLLTLPAFTHGPFMMFLLACAWNYVATAIIVYFIGFNDNLITE